MAEKIKYCNKVFKNVDADKARAITPDMVHLDVEAYGNKVPDLAFIFAQKIIENPSLINKEDFGPTMLYLMKGVRYKAMSIDGFGYSSGDQIDQSLFERDYKEFNATKEDFYLKEGRDFDWEIYEPWVSGDKFQLPSRTYKYINSKYMKVIDGKIKFTKLFFSVQKQFDMYDKHNWITFENMREFAVAL